MCWIQFVQISKDRAPRFDRSWRKRRPLERIYHVSVSSFVYSTRGIGSPLGERKTSSLSMIDRDVLSIGYSQVMEIHSTSTIHLIRETLTGDKGKGSVYECIGIRTGWSASRSAPYSSTLLEHWSRSMIRRGNQGVSSTSTRKDTRKGLRYLYSSFQALFGVSSKNLCSVCSRPFSAFWRFSLARGEEDWKGEIDHQSYSRA